MNIFFATEEHLPRILEISNWAAEHTIANFATEPETLEDWTHSYHKTREKHAWLVAEEEGVVLGWCRTLPHKMRGAYAWCADVSVYVDPNHQKKRVGLALYRVLIAIAKKQGYRTLIAGITAGHEPSEKLHAKLGFVKAGTLHRVGWKQGAWRDVCYWELSLDDSAAAPEPIKPAATCR